MIEGADSLERYLPISYRTPKEEEYVRFLWEAFRDNCSTGKYQFAFLAYHMLTMCFVYFNIWRIKLIDPKAFGTALIGFSQHEKALLEATSPFTFSVVPERTVMRFLKLIQCDNAKIGTYAKLVDERNETAHSNGNIFFGSEIDLTRKVQQIIRVVQEIQEHSVGTILEGYKRFLIDSASPEERQFLEIHDQVREILVHENYMSLNDLSICAQLNIDCLAEQPGYAEIAVIHAEVQAYPFDEERLAELMHGR